MLYVQFVYRNMLATRPLGAYSDVNTASTSNVSIRGSICIVLARFVETKSHQNATFATKEHNFSLYFVRILTITPVFIFHIHSYEKSCTRFRRTQYFVIR